MLSIGKASSLAGPVSDSQDTGATVKPRIELTTGENIYIPPMTSDVISYLIPTTTANATEINSASASNAVLSVTESENILKDITPIHCTEVVPVTVPTTIVKEKNSARETISMMVRHTVKRSSPPQASVMSSTFKGVQRKTPLNVTTTSFPCMQSSLSQGGSTTSSSTSSLSPSPSSPSSTSSTSTAAAAATTTTTIAVAASTVAAVTVDSVSCVKLVASSSDSISPAYPPSHTDPGSTSGLIPTLPSSKPLSSSTSSSSTLPPSSSSNALPSFSSSSSTSSSTSTSSHSNSNSSPRLSIILPTVSSTVYTAAQLPNTTNESFMSTNISQELSSIAHQFKNTTNTIIPDKVLTNVEITKDFNDDHSVRDSPLCFNNDDQEKTPQTDSEIINDSTDSSMISKRNILESLTTAPLNALLDVVCHSDNIVIPSKIIKSATASTDTTSGLINSDIHNEGTTGETGKKRPFSDNTQNAQNAQNGQNGIQSDIIKVKKVKINNGAMQIPEKIKGISNWALNLARKTQKTELRQCTSKKKISRKRFDQWDRAVAYLRTKNHYVTLSVDDETVAAPSTSTSTSTSTSSVVTSHVTSNTVQPWRCVMCNHMMSGVQSTNCSRCNHVCTHVTSQPAGVLPVGQGTRIYPKPLTAHTKPGWQRVSALSHEKVAPDCLPCDKKSTSSTSQPLNGNATFTAIADIGKNKISRMDNSEYVCKSSEMYGVTERMLPRSADTIKNSKHSNPKGSNGSTGGSNTLSGSSTSSSSSHTSIKNISSHQSTASLLNNTGKTLSSSSSSSSSSRVPNNVPSINIATSSSSTSSSRTSAPSTSTSSSILSINSSKSVPSSKSSTSLVQAPLTKSSATSISGSTTESFIDLTNDDDDEQCSVQCVKDKTKLIERTIPVPVQTQPSHQHQLDLVQQEDAIRFQKYRKLKEQQQQHQHQLQQHQHQQQRLPGHSSSSLDSHGNQSSSTTKKRNFPFSHDDDVTTFISNTKNKQTKPFESAPKGQKYPPLTASPRSDKDKSRSSQPMSFAPPAPRPLSSSSSSSSSLNAHAKTSNGQSIRLVPSWTPTSSSSLPPPPLGPFLPRSTQNFSTSQSVGSANDKINQNTRFCRRSVPLAKSSLSLQSKDSPESFNKLNVDDFSTG